MAALSSISVIVPTFNRGGFLTRALNSVLAQAFAVKEIIVVDDGSTDNTQALVTKNYPQIIYLQQENRGVSAARNRGINAANSDWLAFLDADDCWHRQKLAKQREALLNNSDYRLCHTNEVWYKNNQHVNQRQHHRKYGGWIFQRCLERCLISPSSVLVHRNVLTTCGLFDEALPACEDYDLWLRITAVYPVLYVEQPLTIKHGGHPDQLSKKYKAMDRFRIYALKKIIEQGQLSAEQRHAANKMLITKANIYLQGALKRENIAEAAYYQQLIAQYQHAATS